MTELMPLKCSKCQQSWGQFPGDLNSDSNTFTAPLVRDLMRASIKHGYICPRRPGPGTLLIGLPANTTPEHAAALKQQLANRDINAVIIAGATHLAWVETAL